MFKIPKLSFNVGPQWEGSLRCVTDRSTPTYQLMQAKPFQLVGYAHIVLSKRDIFGNGSSS